MGTIFSHATSTLMGTSHFLPAHTLPWICHFLNAPCLSKKGKSSSILQAKCLLCHTGPRGEASRSHSWDSESWTDTNGSFKGWELSFMTGDPTTSDNTDLLFFFFFCTAAA